jgi:hypothetical protein
MSKQTAVSWLVEQIDNPHTLYWLREAIDQALEMERQQIIDIDYRLSVIEDYAKGEAADEITKLRKYLTQTFTEPKND